MILILLICTIKSHLAFRKYCNNPDLNFCLVEDFAQFSDFEIVCDYRLLSSSLVLFPSTRLIFDQQINMINCSFETVYVHNLNGIAVDKLLFNQQINMLVVLNSDFVFKMNAKEFEQKLFSEKNFSNIKFEFVGYIANTSREIFKDAHINILSFKNMVDTKLSRNYLNFDQSENKNSIDLNSTIQELELFLFNIKLSNQMLDEGVFEKVERMRISNQIVGIEYETFASFKQLKELTFVMYSLKAFFHQVGIKWMKSLNNNVKVNFSNDSTRNQFRLIKQLTVSLYEQEIIFMKLRTNFEKYSFPNEDFCLFVDFPHKQLVFPIFDKCLDTCLFKWLTQYQKYSYYFTIPCHFNVSVNCNYSEMLTACNYLSHIEDLTETKAQNNSIINELYYLYDPNYKNKFYDFILSIYLLPTLCFLGFATNVLNIIVLNNRHFKKEMKNRMFKQMLMGSYVNLLICLIHLFGLTTKCMYTTENVCITSLVYGKVFRYIALTVYVFFGSALKTCSKILQILIAFDRFMLSTDSKNPLLLKLSRINLRTCLIASLIFSLLINSVKLFQYKYEIVDDRENQLNFPLIFQYFFDFYFIYSYFNILNILINNLCLFILQLIIDFSLLFFIRESIKNKIKILNSKNDNKQNVNIRAERSLKMMIIINGFITFLLHSPDLIISITVAMSFNGLEYKQTMLDFFSFVLNNISDICYILSYSINFFLYYFFNSCFRMSFKNIFFRKKHTIKPPIMTHFCYMNKNYEVTK